MNRLVLSVPHGGVLVPPGLRPPFDPRRGTAWLRAQSDAYTIELYDVPGVRRIVFPWSRFVVDPNRAEGQENEGGVVPKTDFDERPLHAEGGGPDAEECRRRVETLHRPYHEELAALLADTRTVLFVDGHSCAPIGPERSPDPGAARPDVVLSNGGDLRGEPLSEGPSPSVGPAFLRLAAERIGALLLHTDAPPGGPDAEVRGSVRLNHPFPGGHITQRHARADGPVPGFQLELNQRLWVDARTWAPIPGRIPWLRGVVTRWLAVLVEEAAAGRARA